MLQLIITIKAKIKPTQHKIVPSPQIRMKTAHLILRSQILLKLILLNQVLLLRTQLRMILHHKILQPT